MSCPENDGIFWCWNCMHMWKGGLWDEWELLKIHDRKKHPLISTNNNPPSEKKYIVCPELINKNMKRNLQLNWFFCVNSTVQIITPSPKINTPHPHRQCNYHPCDFGIGVEATGNYLVEKKLVQILGSASGREGRFQKLLLTCRTWIDFLEFLHFKDGI